ncbi:MAG: UDP-N-acetylmuramate dehydrogenase [Anaerolineae bacterium]
MWQFDTSPCHRVVIPALSAFCEAAAALGIAVATAEPLARHTTFHIGGPADLYVAVDRIARLERLAETAAAHALPFTVLGGGSNILVSDRGIRGLVIANQARDFGLTLADIGLEEPTDRVPLTDDTGPVVVAAAGAALAGLARWTVKQGWAGLEWAVSIPGTVGGAVIGNAGAHGGDIAGTLAWALVWHAGQGRARLTADELAFTYRSSRLKQQLAAGDPPPVVLAAGFRLTPGDAAAIAARADAFLARRRATQPTEPSAGSIFRNPPGDHAGRLIEAAGLKGERIGGAQISPRHANFIVNVAQATATDVVALIDLCRRRVFDLFGVELVPEIQFLGDWPAQPPYKSLFTT